MMFKIETMMIGTTQNMTKAMEIANTIVMLMTPMEMALNNVISSTEDRQTNKRKTNRQTNNVRYGVATQRKMRLNSHPQRHKNSCKTLLTSLLRPG